MIARLLPSLAAFTLMAASSATLAEGFPQWAYPGCPTTQASAAADTNRAASVPGSGRHFTRADIADWSVSSDWFPDEHPPPPPVLTASHDKALPACGYCHLPTGSGRPENANIAGLPVSYILAQVAAFHSNKRGAAATGWPPSVFMAKVSAALSDADLAAAADYFSRLPAGSWVRVVESATVPGYSPACFVFRQTGGPRMSLGSAIVEMPTDEERFELRDPHATYVAYVPPGSIGRGRGLASNGGGRTQPCGACHGAGLKGGESLPGPPLAGRFPGYLFRQLYAFKSGSRGGDSDNPMRSVVARLTQRDMIDLAAFATSVPP